MTEENIYNTHSFKTIEKLYFEIEKLHMELDRLNTKIEKSQSKRRSCFF
jgi:hypothetical protein